MIRKFKTLGLTLVAIFAVSAVTASAAMAEGEFRSEAGGTVTLTGTQSGKHVFTAGSAKVECEVATFAGEATQGDTSVSAHPTYENCTAFTFFTAKIKTEGCNYVFTPGASNGEESFATPVDVSCSGSNRIYIEAGTCKLNISSQNNLNSSSIVNNRATTPDSGIVETAVTSVAYEVTEDGFLCPLSGKGNFSNGTYSGTTTLTGKSGGTPTGIEWYL